MTEKKAKNQRRHDFRDADGKPIKMSVLEQATKLGANAIRRRLKCYLHVPKDLPNFLRLVYRYPDLDDFREAAKEIEHP